MKKQHVYNIKMKKDEMLLLSNHVFIALIIPLCKCQTTTTCSNGLVTSLTASNTTVNYIESRIYPNSYSSNGECNIIITTTIGFLVKLTFEGFIKNSNDKTFFIHDGSTTADPNLVNINNTQTGKAYTSSGNSVYLRNTQSNNGNKVFRIAYIAVSEIPSCASMFTVYNVSTTPQTIQSHSNYSVANYDNNMDSYWLIVKPSQMDVFRFNFEDFKTEAGEDGCKNYDRLILYDGPCTTDNIKQRFCGIQGASLPYASSRTVTTSGKYLLFRLITDGSVTFAGFRMKFYIEDDDDDDDDSNGDDDNDKQEEENAGWIAGPVVGGIIGLTCLFRICQGRPQKQGGHPAPPRPAPAQPAPAANQPNDAHSPANPEESNCAATEEDAASTSSNEGITRNESNTPPPGDSLQEVNIGTPPETESVYSPPPSYQDCNFETIREQPPPPYSVFLNHRLAADENINPSAHLVDFTTVDNDCEILVNSTIDSCVPNTSEIEERNSSSYQPV